MLLPCKLGLHAPHTVRWDAQHVFTKLLAKGVLPYVLVQVTARMTGPAVHSFQQPQLPPQAVPGNQGFAGTGSTEGQVSAALGTKWAHAVNVRLVLERKGDGRVITVSDSSSNKQS